MSDITSNVNLKVIQAPELTSTAYGKNVKEQFKNIDDNFRMLSNSDFVAGKEGSSIFYTELLLWDGTVFTELGCAMLNAITETTDVDWNDPNYYLEQDREKLQPVQVGSTTVHLFNYIKENPKITVLYTLKDTTAGNGDDVTDDSNRIYICSPQVYTFLDMRFSDVEDNGGIGVDDSQFAQLVDFSCILTLEYKELLEENDNVLLKPIFNKANLFPTLYFDTDEKVFKWKIYGNETGVRATGPRGEAGSRAAIWMVKIDDTNIEEPIEQFTYPITYIMAKDSNGEWNWIPFSDVETKPDEGDVCIAFSENWNDDSDDSSMLVDAYISPVIFYESTPSLLYVNTGYNNSLLLNVTGDTMKVLLKSIGPNSSQLACLFTKYTNSSIGFHTIYSKQEGNLYNLVLKPIRSNDDSILTNPDTQDADSSAILDIKYKNIRLSDNNNEVVTIQSDFEQVTGDGIVKINAYGPNGRVDVGSNTHLYGRKVESVNIDALKVTATASVTTSTLSVNTIAGASGSTYIIANKPVRAEVNSISGVYLGCPIGTVVMWAGAEDNVPNEWLLCNGNYFNYDTVQGKTLTQDERDRLNNILAGAYGSYRLPNLQQRFPLGAQQDGSIAVGQTGAAETIWASTNVGSTGGTSQVVLNKQQMPRHNHTFTLTHNSGTLLNTANVGVAGDSGDAHTETYTTAFAGGDTGNRVHAHNNTPPFLAINFIIKYK